MKVLVTGAGGMLAEDLTSCLSERGYEIVALPRNRLDITDLGAIRAAANKSEPELMINCAAYTKVDKAEKEETRARTVNGFGVQNLCLLCQERDIPLVHFSTDYVFDGTKESPYTIYDEPNPISAYGRSKLLGEKYILWLLSKFYLIRTSWLFGLYGKNFIETMLELGQREKQISVVNDQRGCPTWTYHLAQAVVDLIETERYGIYHITNSEPTTWFEFAREIFRLSGRDIEVLPVTSDQFPRPARRPQNSVLDPFPLTEVLLREMPSWRQALKEYLQRRNTMKKVEV
ncbi:MAG: dTDP-4-dehydrorhamnose reductase [Dehalococcoidia bacterium]|nr:MAG: dTDP-4-dehydrorhamnose reductase [Dehalococcoidia bacterium]